MPTPTHPEILRIYRLVDQRQPMPAHLSPELRAWWQRAEKERAESSAKGLALELPWDSHDPGDNGGAGAATSAPAPLSADFGIEQAEAAGLALSDNVRKSVKRYVRERFDA